MKSGRFCQLAALGAVLALVHPSVIAAPACKGPNKNDPGCPGAEEPPPEEPPVEASLSTVVDSATVDWANERIIVRGVDLDTVIDFTLGGSGPLSTGSVSAGEVELLFDATMAGEVSATGSYSLQVDGVDAISIHFITAVVDPLASGCPCDTDWAAQLGGLWSADQSTCYEITGTGVADLAATVLSDPLNPAAYPQFPIGAAYYADDPLASVCRLVQINDSDPVQQELVNFRINATQQADCAVSLQTNICATTEPAVIP